MISKISRIGFRILGNNFKKLIIVQKKKETKGEERDNNLGEVNISTKYREKGKESSRFILFSSSRGLLLPQKFFNSPFFKLFLQIIVHSPSFHRSSLSLSISLSLSLSFLLMTHAHLPFLPPLPLSHPFFTDETNFRQEFLPEKSSFSGHRFPARRETGSLLAESASNFNPCCTLLLLPPNVQ